jgi:radical SAM superfamily enzyme YgiQ (UPF0313 family)
MMHSPQEMKVLLVMPDYRERPFYQINIGLMSISAYLKQKGYAVTCMNMNHHRQDELAELLESNAFDVIGTGGIFIHLPLIKPLVKMLRQYQPQAKIILGGGIASADFEFILDEVNPDFLVAGEGEVSTDLLLQALLHKTDLRRASGIVFRQNGSLMRTEPSPLISDLDSLPFPDYEGFEYGYYLDNFFPDPAGMHNILDISRRRIGFVISSRDCVQNCTFCFRIMGQNSAGRGFRVRSIENFVSEIKYLIHRYGVNEIVLSDDMFAANKNRVAQFCQAIKPLGLRWRCQLRVNVVDEELIRQMKDSGCFLIGYGFESGSPTVLKSMRKGITPAQIDRAIEASVKTNISIQGNFIFGDPAETVKTMEETIRFSRRYKSLFLGFGLIKPYPGSFLYNRLIEQGKIKDKFGFYCNPLTPINMTALPAVDFKYLCRKVVAESVYRDHCVFGKILRLKRIKGDTYDVAIRCHNCRRENRAAFKVDFVSAKKGVNFLVCPHCFQRIVINVYSPKFGNILKSARYACYYYALRLVTASPRVHRLLNALASGLKISGILKKVRG